jgi:hypothetical protein
MCCPHVLFPGLHRLPYTLCLIRAGLTRFIVSPWLSFLSVATKSPCYAFLCYSLHPFYPFPLPYIGYIYCPRRLPFINICASPLSYLPVTIYRAMLNPQEGGGREQPSRERKIYLELYHLLRHAAEREGLKMVSQGYANVADVVYFPLLCQLS